MELSVHREPFLADLQGNIGQLQLFICLRLSLEQMLAFGFDLFARGIVGADQQIADDGALSSAQRGDRDDGRETAAVLADIGQLVDILNAARGLNTNASKPGAIRVLSSTLSALARAITPPDRKC